MMGAMDDLVTFLRARLDGDEQTARAATPGPWTVNPVVYGRAEDGWGEPTNFEITADRVDVVSHQTHEGGGIDKKEDAAHIARHNPARVLREVDAKRRILELYVARTRLAQGDDDADYENIQEDAYLLVVRHLALPYADHADYRDEWRP